MGEAANMMRREMKEENMGEMRMGERLRVSGNVSSNGMQHPGGQRRVGDSDENAYQKWRKNTERPHSSAIKYMHHDLLQRFSMAFARCVPSVAVQQHRRKTCRIRTIRRTATTRKANSRRSTHPSTTYTQNPATGRTTSRAQTQSDDWGKSVQSICIGVCEPVAKFG